MKIIHLQCDCGKEANLSAWEATGKGWAIINGKAYCEQCRENN